MVRAGIFVCEGAAEVEIISNNKKNMSYFQTLDAWLEKVLQFAEGEDDEQWLTRVKKQIKDEILKSYRNGQKAGPRQDGETDKSKTVSDAVQRPKRHRFQGRPSSHSSQAS